MQSSAAATTSGGSPTGDAVVAVPAHDLFSFFKISFNDFYALPQPAQNDLKKQFENERERQERIELARRASEKEERIELARIASEKEKDRKSTRLNSSH